MKLLAFLVGAGIALAPPAAATVDYAPFLAALHHDGFTGTDDALKANGDWVCARLSEGESNPNIVKEFLDSNRVTSADAQQFIAESVKYLCGQHPVEKTHVNSGIVV